MKARRESARNRSSQNVFPKASALNRWTPATATNGVTFITHLKINTGAGWVGVPNTCKMVSRAGQFTVAKSSPKPATNQFLNTRCSLRESWSRY
jgi:hypothetical protein